MPARLLPMGSIEGARDTTWGVARMDTVEPNKKTILWLVC
jgi:hypothetical protein